MLSVPVTPNTTIDITDLTHSVVDGNGVFDKLMKAVTAHLEQEFQKGRIKGTEYSTVYLSALQSTLTTALTFVLTKGKTEAEIALLEQRKASELAQINGAGITSDSILGKQREVLTNQANGFIRDSEQKAADIMVKAFSVVATTNDLEVADSGTYGVSPTNVNAILTKLKTGIGA